MATGLLLLHAFPLDHDMWAPQVSALERWLPIVAPDFPGFGKAAASTFLPTIDGAADAAADALTRAGLDDAVVCGLSMGGYVALAFWRRHRERVAGMVLANTRGDADAEPARERRRALARRLRQEGNVLVNEPPPLLSDRAPAEVAMLVKRIIANQSAQAIAAASEAMAERPDSTPNLRELSVKALVVSAEHDTLIPPDITKAMAAQIPGNRFALIAGAGHLSNLEQPDAFNELLREHLRRCGVIEGDRPR